MFRALEVAIGSTAEGKDVGVREVVGDAFDPFFEPNFRNMEDVFMLEGGFGLESFVQKDAAGERTSVAILKSLCRELLCGNRCNRVQKDKSELVGLAVFVP